MKLELTFCGPNYICITIINPSDAIARILLHFKQRLKYKYLKNINDSLIIIYFRNMLDREIQMAAKVSKQKLFIQIMLEI